MNVEGTDGPVSWGTAKPADLETDDIISGLIIRSVEEVDGILELHFAIAPTGPDGPSLDQVPEVGTMYLEHDALLQVTRFDKEAMAAMAPPDHDHPSEPRYDENGILIDEDCGCTGK